MPQSQTKIEDQFSERRSSECIQSDLLLLKTVIEVYDKKFVSELLDLISPGDWPPTELRKVHKGQKEMRVLGSREFDALSNLLPSKPPHYDEPDFKFIDLFAGIGGIRSGFEKIGGKCVFTSEWNKFAQRTYKANWYSASDHTFNEDIRSVTLSQVDVCEDQAYANIDDVIPNHDVLLAGFPCQPFSLAGVSKKNSLGRAHGFECDAQGTLFFDVARILKAKQPRFFVLENVKNLKSHDNRKTFRIILQTLEELGYDVADVENNSPNDPKVIDAKNFVPQHRERIVLVGFRKDLGVRNFSLRAIKDLYPESVPTIAEILDDEVDDKYVLTPKLWEYLYNYALKHSAKGNGFGYGLIDPNNPNSVARTLSARYYKDGSEILINDRFWDAEIAKTNFTDPKNLAKRPRRLTPRVRPVDGL